MYFVSQIGSNRLKNQSTQNQGSKLNFNPTYGIKVTLLSLHTWRATLGFSPIKELLGLKYWTSSLSLSLSLSSEEIGKDGDIAVEG